MKFIFYESVSGLDACQRERPRTGQFGGSHELLMQQPSLFIVYLPYRALAPVFPCLWFVCFDIVSATAFTSYGWSALPTACCDRFYQGNDSVIGQLPGHTDVIVHIFNLIIFLLIFNSIKKKIIAHRNKFE